MIHAFMAQALSTIYVEPTDEVVASLARAIPVELDTAVRRRLDILFRDYQDLVLGGDALDRVMASLSHFEPNPHITNLIRETLVELAA